MKKWEYLVVSNEPGLSDETLLTRRGEEGWELVAIRHWPDNEQDFYFKREKIEEPT